MISFLSLQFALWLSLFFGSLSKMNIATTIEKLSTSISCQEYIKYALHKVESQIQANPTSQNLNKRTKLQKEIDGHASDVSNRREELARLFKLDIIDELVKSNNQMKVANQKQNEAIQTLHGSIEKLETQLNTLERFIPMLLGAIANRSVATPNDFDTNKEGNFGDENGGSNEPASNSSLYRTESESPSGDPVKDTNTSTEVSPALTQSPRKRKRQGSNSENAPKKPVLSYLERVKRGEQDLFETPHKSFTNRMILCKTGQEQLDVCKRLTLVFKGTFLCGFAVSPRI